jgi:poly-gamma-glutamate synthesis protein (capsule biosynthesis protein)
MTRRTFLGSLAAAGLASTIPGLAGAGGRPAPSSNGTRLFLCGDVMTGRGVDQILPNPAEPEIHEPYVQDARDYVKLAEAENGPIPKPVDFDYIWGDAPAILDSLAPHARIINLETAVTDHPEPWPAKGINYRMHPRNAPVLSALGPDACVLANNHVLDWQTEGLRETLAALGQAGFGTAGAGDTLEEARAPFTLDLGGGRRLLVFTMASPTSGVPAEWAAGPDKPGVHFLPDLATSQLKDITALVDDHRRPGDIVLASIHWGGNWGYDVPDDQRRFAHGLIDEAGVDLVHGHSSHHPKGMEVHGGRLILYGCGDFINDY